jgi:multidrug efflux pump subunit AcrA (membrane-fusion protein)
MKTRSIFLAAGALLAGAGVLWLMAGHSVVPVTAAANGRKVLYYTCAMHPWVRETKPGPCPVCGMNLTPVYANEGSVGVASSNTNAGEITLESENISVINVQTDLAGRRPVSRTLHFSGEITGNSQKSAWFEFTIYQRDLEWLKTGQMLQVFVSGVPDRTFAAQIKARGGRPFVDTNFVMMTGSTTMRAEMANPPVQVGDLGTATLFNGLHAEAHLVAETEPVLAIPRSAVISRGEGAMVFVDRGDGHYAPREVQLGRVGNELVEVTAGLKEGEKVVTTGNVLIDSEAQLRAGE